MAEKLYLIDSHHLIYRAHFALIRDPLTDKNGQVVSAIYGFSKMIVHFLQEHDPERLIFAFDKGRNTFRKDLYPDYKANRKKTPGELKAQFGPIREIVTTLGVPVLDHDDYEADDLIGTLCRLALEKGFEVHILSGDKDLFQLLQPGVFFHYIKRGISDTEIIDRTSLNKVFSLAPESIIELKGLMGDSSDNIPGVRGVGEKTAIKLIEKYETLEGVYENIENEKGKLKERLIQDRDLAFLSRDLGRIRTDVAIDFDWGDTRFNSETTLPALLPIFKDYGFHSITEQLEVREEINYDFVLVTEIGELRSLIQRAIDSEVVAIDLETSSLDIFSLNIVGISLAIEESTGYYIPTGHQLPCPINQIPLNEVLESFAPLLSSEKVVKVFHNAKFEIQVFEQHGLTVASPFSDTMIASYICDPSKSHGLKTLSGFYLNEPMKPIEDLIGKGKNQISFELVNIEDALPYAGHDAIATLKLFNYFTPLIRERLKRAYDEIELPLVRILAHMEKQGIGLDVVRLKEISVELAEKLKNTKAEIYFDFGREFNINSPKQLREILFDDLKINEQLPFKIKKTKTGYSTDVSVLEKIKYYHPGIDKILQYRELNKLITTYTDALPNLISPTTGRIHTNFHQAVTATGRLASSQPNLQNIPVRSFYGKQIRAAFLPESSQNSFISADYSQIELRIFAHLSGDEKLQAAFNNDEDIHTETARQVFGVDEVTDETRQKAKAINFGILYGMSSFGLSESLHISRYEAQEILSIYFEKYQGVRDFIDSTIEKCREQGYAETIMGRRRKMAELASSNSNIRKQGERLAINTMVQGSAADLIKIAMISCSECLNKEGFRSNLILQVHDELIFDGPDEELPALTELIRDKMENCLKLSVPLRVNINQGKNWGELK